MGTQKSIGEKMSFIRELLQKSMEKEKPYKVEQLAAKLMLAKYCSREKALEIIQCFVNAGEARITGDEIYGQ